MSSANSRLHRIALVDCDNFYASCERVFNPRWHNKPIAVLSNNDGCIVARSREVKQLGIKMGEPFFKCRDALVKADAVVVSSNYELYGSMSSRVMEILAHYSSDIEIYSIDEAWLDFSEVRPEQVPGHARKLARDVHQWTGIPVTIGVAPSKVLAKIASRIAKKRALPGAVFDLGSADCLDGILESFPVRDLWGIGSRRAETLRELGILNALQLRDANPEMIRKKLSVIGSRIQQELKGVPCFEREDTRAGKQEIIVSRTLGKAVADLHSLTQSVVLHASMAAEKLRSQASRAGAVQVHISTDRFRNGPQHSGSCLLSFPSATASSIEISKAAAICAERVFKTGMHYRRAGVILTNLEKASTTQLDFFRSDSERMEKLMEAIDCINSKHGRSTVTLGRLSSTSEAGWRPRRLNRSPRFTTQWSELAIVR